MIPHRLTIIANEWLPATMLHPVDDALERWEAMTAHHLVLGLLPLEEQSGAVFLVGTEIHAHPSIVAGIHASAFWVCRCTNINGPERTHCSRCGARRESQ